MSIGFVRKSSTPASAAARRLWALPPLPGQQDEVDVVLALLGPEALAEPQAVQLRHLPVAHGDARLLLQPRRPGLLAVAGLDDLVPQALQGAAQDGPGHVVVFNGEDFHGVSRHVSPLGLPCKQWELPCSALNPGRLGAQGPCVTRPACAPAPGRRIPRRHRRSGRPAGPPMLAEPGRPRREPFPRAGRAVEGDQRPARSQPARARPRPSAAKSARGGIARDDHVPRAAQGRSRRRRGAGASHAGPPPIVPRNAAIARRPWSRSAVVRRQRSQPEEVERGRRGRGGLRAVVVLLQAHDDIGRPGRGVEVAALLPSPRTARPGPAGASPPA